MSATAYAVTLKVMRLTRPLLSRSLRYDTETNEVAVVPLAPSLSLPATFAPVYCGEDFSVLCVLTNQSESSLANVRMEITISMSNSSPLLLSSLQEKELRGKGSMQGIAVQPLTTAGPCQLEVTVMYEDPQAPSAEQHFRKVYRFESDRAFHVRTKSHEAPGNRTLVETQIENILPQPIFVEEVVLVAGSENQVRATDQKGVHLASRDVHQWVFSVTQSTEPELGRLLITWRSPSGERGKLATGNLSRRI